MFLKNTWYVGARSEELTDKPLGRTICNERVVFFRGKDNEVCAVEDFCPHRGAALSLGYIEDGHLVCGYHGLVMGCEGKTIAMPMQRVQGFPKIKRHAVAERHGLIWIWCGDPDLADVSTIPSFEWTDNPDWVYAGGVYHVKSDYRLMIDNLMDLTHETYVHKGSIGQPEIDESPVHTFMEGDIVVTKREMNGIYAPPHWQAALKAAGLAPEAKVDRWQYSRFYLPSHIMIDVGVALAGRGGYNAAAQDKVSSTVVNFMTPETDSTHWYFWGMARTYLLDDSEFTKHVQDEQRRIFAQDLDVLQAQQENLLAYPDRQLLMLNIDSGGVQARRQIERAMKEARHIGSVTS